MLLYQAVELSKVDISVVFMSDCPDALLIVHPDPYATKWDECYFSSLEFAGICYISLFRSIL